MELELHTFLSSAMGLPVPPLGKAPSKSRGLWVSQRRSADGNIFCPIWNRTLMPWYTKPGARSLHQLRHPDQDICYASSLFRGNTVVQICTDFGSLSKSTGLECSKYDLYVCDDGIFILKLNSMVWVHERTIPTERPPLVGEVIANFCG
jgi:hypothetical protein